MKEHYCLYYISVGVYQWCFQSFPCVLLFSLLFGNLISLEVDTRFCVVSDLWQVFDFTHSELTGDLWTKVMF